MLAQVPGQEVDALFLALDDDGGGTLDAAEIRKAFKTLVEEADSTKEHIRQLQTAAAEAHKEARGAQEDWKRRTAEEARQEAEQAEREAREEEERRRAAAEAKEARLAAKAERQAAEVAEKQAFEAKVALRRQTNRALA